jgi:dTDP-4-amino-4,6-dideoxygalactose transaminase
LLSNNLVKTVLVSHDVPMNRPNVKDIEIQYVLEALKSSHLSGDGPFTKKCHAWLEQHTQCYQCLLTHSCTAALEMAAMLIGLEPGDEVIMPSFTFVSTANAVVLRGAVPVFVDIRPDTMNIDETLIEAAITNRTKAIFVVHYAGVAGQMDTIMEIAERRGLYVVEDAAQGILAEFRGKPLGSIGHLSALSFHETKNIISGEGGALLINAPEFASRAHIIREKGTNRTAFFEGLVDKYTWVDFGSSYLPSDLLAALLLGQLERSNGLRQDRMRLWNYYNSSFADLEQQGLVRRPAIPDDCAHNGHIYYLIVQSAAIRSRALSELKSANIGATFHYIPLHSAPAGQRYGRTHGPMTNTDQLHCRLLRLPVWHEMTDEQAETVVARTRSVLMA